MLIQLKLQIEYWIHLLKDKNFKFLSLMSPKLIFLVFLVFLFDCTQGQAPVYLTESQLLSIQNLQYPNVNSYLQNIGWTKETDNVNQTKDYFSYNLDFSVEKWQIKTTSSFEGYLFLYYKQGIPNLVIYQASYSCYDKVIKSQGNGIRKDISNRELDGFRVQKPSGISMEFRNYKNKNSSKMRYSVLVFDQSSLSKLIQVKKDTAFAVAARLKFEKVKKETEKREAEARVKAEDDARKMAEKSRKEKIEQSRISGDSLSNRELFESAISQYTLAKNYSLPSETKIIKELDAKIQECIVKNNILKVADLIFSGDSLLKEKKYSQSLIKYKEARSFLTFNLSEHISFSNKKTTLDKKILDAQNISDAIELSSRDQSYKLYNPEEYRKFITLNYNYIYSMILNNKISGSIYYTTVIKFDQKGKNLSFVKVSSSSNIKLNTYISNKIVSGLLPIQRLNYYIPSNEEIKFSINWETKSFKAKYKKKNIKYGENFNNDIACSVPIERFIKQQSYKNGSYKFEKLEKSVNGRTYSDLSLVNYRNNLGPVKCLYSFVLPGLGKRIITEGQKGGGTIVLFLISTAISVGSKIYSDNQYNSYKNAINVSEKNTAYDAANMSNKIFLISGGIAATIYLYDIFWVFGKGISNNKQSTLLKSQLKKAPINLLESPIKPAINEIP